MTKTVFDALLELPADATLRAFVETHGVPVPRDLVWTDTPKTSRALIESVAAWGDMEARDRFIGALLTGLQLDEPSGKQAMFHAAAGDGAVLAGLAGCLSDAHRSFWLYVHHSRLFERACDYDYLERNESHAQQRDLGVKVRPSSSPDAMLALRRAVASYYERELRCGDRSMAYLIERRPGVHLLTVHVKDLAALRLEFEGDQLTRRVGNPNIHMVLEYSEATGVVRTVVRGGAKFHRMLVDAFAEHLLGVKVDPRLIKSPTLDLSRLREGFIVPQALADGFVVLKIKSISLLSPDTNLKLDCAAMASSGLACVTDLLRQHFPDECPLRPGWIVSAATLNLHFPRELGRARAKVVTVEVTNRGRLNLHKFEPRLQAQLEGYLASLGILRQGQVLEASGQDAADEQSMVDGGVHAFA